MRDLRRIVFWTVVLGFVLGIFLGDNGVVGFIASIIMHYWNKRSA